MKVIATRKAFYKGALIKAGQLVDIVDDVIPKWAQEIGGQPEKATESVQLELVDAKNIETVNQDTQETSKNSDTTSESVQLEVTDDLLGKTEQELLEILDDLQLKGIEANLMIDDADKKTVIEQIYELKTLLLNKNIDK